MNDRTSPLLDLEPTLLGAAAPLADDRLLSILGVTITDVSRPRALLLLTDMLANYQGRSRTVYFVNAHTLNVAAANDDYRHALNRGDYVFGDGTGVRWAARLQKVRLHDNLNGTDLVPQLMRANRRRQYRFFLLGGDQATIDAAARYAAEHFDGWTLAGHHHGYIHNTAASREVVAQINVTRPDLLLVGMGNPLQEQWIDAHCDLLHVPLCLGVGGLFHYWAGDLKRAPGWLRRFGAEWLGILLQQPHKARRYLVGNPLFLWQIAREALFGRRVRV